MSNEIFPQTEQELLQIIRALREMLSNEAYKEQWKEISEELKIRKNQLQELTIKNNVL